MLPFSPILGKIHSLSWAGQTPMRTLAPPFGQKWTTLLTNALEQLVQQPVVRQLLRIDKFAPVEIQKVFGGVGVQVAD